jgi:hypothetical protein
VVQPFGFSPSQIRACEFSIPGPALPADNSHDAARDHGKLKTRPDTEHSSARALFFELDKKTYHLVSKKRNTA